LAQTQPQTQSQARPQPQALARAQGDTDTLREALEQTYRSNPTLMAQREQLRSLDEAVAIARAGLRPNVSATVGLNQDLLTTNAGEGRNFSLGLNVDYPLFNAGRVRNQIRAADIRVEAGRADLRGTEGDLFTEAVGVYMDVIRDRSIVALNENQVRVLRTNLEATRDRFEVGDLTRTDVAQSEARLALAQSSLATVQGRLRSSEEAFRRIIGELPDELDPPPTLPRLPATPDEAVTIALENNPDLRAVANQVRAAGLDIEVLRADRLPTVNAVGSGDYLNPAGLGGRAAERPPVRGKPCRRTKWPASASACRRASPSIRRPGRRARAPVERAAQPAGPSRRSRRSASSSPAPAAPLPPTARRWMRSNRTRSRSPPTSWRLKGPGPSRRSARATCSTC
jgi:outer membrane protein TolC